MMSSRTAVGAVVVRGELRRVAQQIATPDRELKR